VHLLLVEDDRTIADPLIDGLTRAGFDVELARTGAEALAATGYELVLLDLGLPDLDGTEVCRRIRAGSDVPVIVVTARGDEFDRVMLLELGADDYVVKPFGLRELVARIRAVSRRTNGSTQIDLASERIEVGRLVVDSRARSVSMGADPVELTPKEFDLLAFLATDVGRVFTRTDILRSVWDEHWYGSTKTLDVHVASIRRKLGKPGWIETVRGVGFRLVDADGA
jgi:DNA-binding response OmpR family regulator